MKNLSKYIFFSVLLTTNVFAQEGINGKIEVYNNPEASIFVGMGEPIVIGTMEATGEFNIPLTNDFKSVLLTSVEKENKKGKGWSFKLNTLQEAYGNCGETVKVTNGDQTMVHISNFGAFYVANIEEKKPYGMFMYVSSPKFADDFVALGKFKSTVGYYLDWVYFDEEASVKGSCELPSYTLSGASYVAETVYDLNFRSGWNLYKYEVAEVFNDEDGRQYARKVFVKTIEEIPEGTEIYFQDEIKN
jgi:hypothetical protein